MPDGILIIDKPANFTSHDVVNRLRKILQTKRIGHTGTLDPFATGVLVMLIGKATRLAQFLDRDVKEYEALLQFGRETDTGDLTGEAVADSGIADSSDVLEKLAWEDVFDEFRGEILQTPPMFSAKKVKGKKLYEMARKGIEIEREPIKVRISELNLLDKSHIPDPKSQIRIRVVCSAGTYIRTLAEDIGRKVGLGAHLAELRRTRAGHFDLSKALTIKELERVVGDEKIDQFLISMNDAVAHLAEQTISEDDLKKILMGQRIKASVEQEEGQQIRLADSAGNLIAIGAYAEEGTKIQPRIVFG